MYRRSTFVKWDFSQSVLESLPKLIYDDYLLRKTKFIFTNYSEECAAGDLVGWKLDEKVIMCESLINILVFLTIFEKSKNRIVYFAIAKENFKS